MVKHTPLVFTEACVYFIKTSKQDCKDLNFSVILLVQLVVAFVVFEITDDRYDQFYISIYCLISNSIKFTKKKKIDNFVSYPS